MLRLPAQLHNFSGAFAGANGYYDLIVSLDDLVRAAITVGYPNLAAATMPATFHRTWAVLFRASIVLAYLDAPTGDRVVRSADYNRADRSEKGSISYYLGLFGAKLAAELLLQTPWLLHYDAYHRLAHRVGPIASRPDLIGHATSGEWIAIEAKGRTNGWTDALRASAKTQAQTLSDVVHPGGTVDPIQAKVASLSFFDGEGWSLLMDDPPAKRQPLRLATSSDELHRAYYAPVVEYVLAALEREEAESIQIEDVNFKVVHDPSLDVFVGVANAVIESNGTNLDAIRSALAGVLEERSGRTRSLPPVEDVAGRAWSVGTDGVIVRLGERWR